MRSDTLVQLKWGLLVINKNDSVISGSLDPQGSLPFTLPSGRDVLIPVTKPVLVPSKVPNRWGYGKFKPIVLLDGEDLFAEIALVKMLQKDGWSAVWVDCWRSKFHLDMPGTPNGTITFDDLSKVPSLKPHLNAFREFSGGWDVLAWKDEKVLFCESKRTKKDKLKPNQFAWMEERLDEGARPSNFLIAEWSFPDDHKKKTSSKSQGQKMTVDRGGCDLPCFSGPNLT